MADEINCDVLYSAGKFLDVLPKAVNKGSSLSKLVNNLGIQAADVLVAGDTMNDLDMYACGYKSVAVGESEDALLKSTAGMPQTYHAKTAGAGGILEAMSHFEQFRHFVRSPLYVA